MGLAIVATADEIHELETLLGNLRNECNERLNEEAPILLTRKIRGEICQCVDIQPLGKYVIPALGTYVRQRIERLRDDLRLMMLPSDYIVQRMSRHDHDDNDRSSPPATIAAASGSANANSDDAVPPREITTELNQQWIDDANQRQTTER